MVKLVRWLDCIGLLVNPWKQDLAKRRVELKAENLQRKLRKLHEQRTKKRLAKKGKKSGQRNVSGGERLSIFKKTAYKCHVCGTKQRKENLAIDHVRPHSHGGKTADNNLLAICVQCNRLRWAYLPEELRWVMDLGVWARSEIEKARTADEIANGKNPNLGNRMAERFVKHRNAKAARREKG